MPDLGFYERGQYNVQCDECGRGFKSSDALRKRWDNAMVCNTGTCWEPRQPQDFVRGIKDDQSVPIGRPRLGVSAGTILSWFGWESASIVWYDSKGLLILWSPS